MAAGPGLRSKVVAVLKVGLPLVAVAMLAALFLISETDRPGGALVFSAGDMAALGEGMRVTQPVFSGVTGEADRFRFTAEVVAPDAAPPTRADVTALEGQIDFEGGPRVDLSAARAALDLESQRMTLEGPARVETADGYAFAAGRVELDLRAGALEAAGAVAGDGPMGRIEAGRLSVSPPEGDGEGRRFLFRDSVRLVYDPPGRPD